ncbi:membrane-associated protein, putative [Bodo saltans]|uniref:Membrane-associated protein, putative n=1 Tax=Bodo saltans TaxID=75058 RepID=A0A0S4J3N3_BODSA|nr:membrane-associated protein, putative [Bodo saltans]|eukprot:CUG69974.1 membrane-associated protein, putative [Bodo saltans]
MKANYFNLLLLLFVGVPFVMGVVSVTNSMYTLNMSALPTLDLPLITQYFTIVCPMFGNCTRSGAGVASDEFVGTLEKVSEALGCSTTSVNLARAFCLIALIVSVSATAAAAGAAQEVTCAERFWVRVVILVSSAATLVFSLIAVILISSLRQCLSGEFAHIEHLVTFFTPRPAVSNVDSIAFPVYVCAMAFAAAAVIMSIVWIRGIAGPDAVDRAAQEEEEKRKGKEMQSKLLQDDDDDATLPKGDHATVDVLGGGTEKVSSPFNNNTSGLGDHDALLFPSRSAGQTMDVDDDPIDVDDFLVGIGSDKRRE